LIEPNSWLIVHQRPAMAKRPTNRGPTDDANVAPSSSGGAKSASGLPASELPLLERLLAGDEATFRSFVVQHHGAMVQVARLFVKSLAVAEEVAQESWAAFVRGLPQFERRSSLRTWLFGIVANRARSVARREGFYVALADDELSADAEGGNPGPSLGRLRFSSDGAWKEPPASWRDEDPERIVANREAMDRLRQALEKLPPAQQAVVVLRDIQGLDTEEVCNILGVSETNLRVLLHRARTKLRMALEQAFQVSER
jgi:RNA polymerase sigma-70 factor (ECF subfamily)